MRAQVHTDAEGRATSVDFVNVPSRLVASGITVSTSRGPVSVDLAWGGAFYALVDATRLGAPRLEVVPENLTALIALGREVKAGLADHRDTVHPEDERLSGVYGTIFVDRFGTLPTGELHQRNVTIFADGQVDRSPCGSGTSARVAALHTAGELASGQSLVHESIVGTRFRARVLEETADGVIPVVTGSAHRVATSTFEVDSLDDLVPGFALR